jgi:nucleoside-diphosphate-sugar epimerase
MTANIIEYSLRTGKAPRCNYLKGNMQFVDVDEVASGIVHSLFAGIQGANVIHHCDDEIICIGELKAYMERRYNRKIQEVELDAWLQAARDAGLSDTFSTLMGEILTNADNTAVFKTLARS